MAMRGVNVRTKILLITRRKYLIFFALTLLLTAGCTVAYFMNDIKVAKPLIPYPKEMSIFIDLTENRLYVMRDGEIVKKFPIASGKIETPSPIGDWHVIGKDNWGEGFGGYWFGLDVPWGKYGIHGTSDPHTIGSDASHGCIRMFSADAKELFKLIKYKTKVKILGGPFGPFGMRFRTLIPGDRGSDVYEVQVRLKRLGFLEGKPDGVYGEQTKRAVFKFQKQNKMLLSNLIERKFYDKLGIVLIE